LGGAGGGAQLRRIGTHASGVLIEKRSRSRQARRRRAYRPVAIAPGTDLSSAVVSRTAKDRDQTNLSPAYWSLLQIRHRHCVFVFWSAATRRRFRVSTESTVEIRSKSNVRSKRRRVAALQIKGIVALRRMRKSFEQLQLAL